MGRFFSLFPFLQNVGVCPLHKSDAKNWILNLTSRIELSDISDCFMFPCLKLQLAKCMLGKM